MEEVREAIRQLTEGADFNPPSKVLGSLSGKSACQLLPGVPYSIATNVAHAEIWNRLWLNRLTGGPRFNPYPDFPAVPEEEWEGVRDTFLAGLDKASACANAEPFVYSCRSASDARRLLLKIAIHTSYHLGQVVLLKRMLRMRSRVPDR